MSRVKSLLDVFYQSWIYNLGYSKMSVQTNIGLMEKTRVERKNEAKNQGTML